MSAAPRDYTCVPAARAQVEQAIDKLNTACGILRKGGLTGTADDIARQVKVLRVHTQKDGFFDWLECAGHDV